MLLLKRIIHTTIWGGPKISRLTGVEGDNIGHLYSLYCREGVSNEILNGEWRGRTLNEVFPLFKSEFGMSRYDYFPLTLALTEAHENLSIQVHPNDAAANALEHRARVIWRAVLPHKHLKGIRALLRGNAAQAPLDVALVVVGGDDDRDDGRIQDDSLHRAWDGLAVACDKATCGIKEVGELLDA